MTTALPQLTVGIGIVVVALLATAYYSVSIAGPVGVIIMTVAAAAALLPYARA